MEDLLGLLGKKETPVHPEGLGKISQEVISGLSLKVTSVLSLHTEGQGIPGIPDRECMSNNWQRLEGLEVGA